MLNLLVIFAVGCALAALYWWFDTRQEKRLKAYGRLSQQLAIAKLPRLADLFEDLSHKDLSGVLSNTYHLAKDLTTGGVPALMHMLEDNFWWQVKERLDDPAQADRLTSLVNGEE